MSQNWVKYWCQHTVYVIDVPAFTFKNFCQNIVDICIIWWSFDLNYYIWLLKINSGSLYPKNEEISCQKVWFNTHLDQAKVNIFKVLENNRFSCIK